MCIRDSSEVPCTVLSHTGDLPGTYLVKHHPPYTATLYWTVMIFHKNVTFNKSTNIYFLEMNKTKPIHNRPINDEC